MAGISRSIERYTTGKPQLSFKPLMLRSGTTANPLERNSPWYQTYPQAQSPGIKPGERSGGRLAGMFECPRVTPLVTHMRDVPEKYRAQVNKMAKKAYPDFQKSNPDVPFVVFRDRMAKGWIAQKREFYRITTDQGFERVTQVDPRDPVAIIAMTVNGSLVAITPPDPRTGLRSIHYQPISGRTERSPLDLPQVVLVRGLDVTQNTFVLTSPHWYSSTIMAVAIHASGDARILRNVQRDVANSIMDVQHHTVHGNDEGEFR